MKLLDVGPVRLLGRFDIIGSRPVPDEESKEPETAMDEDSQAAMAAFDLLQPPKKKQKRQPRAGHSVSKPVGQKAKQLEEKQAAVLAEKKLQGIIDFASDSESALSLVSDEEDEPKAEEDGLPSGHVAARHSQASSSSSAVRLDDAADDAPPFPAPGKRAALRRGEAWGSFFISPLYRSGVHVGWEGLCNLHQDSHDKQGTSCKKSLAKGHLSDAECKLRLKRWLVAGLDDAGWKRGLQRSHHVSFGGHLLSHFATGLDEATLNSRPAA